WGPCLGGRCNRELSRSWRCSPCARSSALRARNRKATRFRRVPPIRRSTSSRRPRRRPQRRLRPLPPPPARRQRGRRRAAVTAEGNEALKQMVQYWNDHAYDAANYAPAIRQLMGNDPKNQFFGRHLVGNIIDGGSNQCPDKTKAGATRAAEVDHAFSVFNNLD